MFFQFGHNSFATRGFAYIREIIEPGGNPRSQSPICQGCRRHCGDFLDNYYDRDMVVQIEESRATKWPDIIGSGHQSSFAIVSQRVIEAWEMEGIGTFPCFPVCVAPPFLKTLTTEPPVYYRLDYKKMVGAELDFEASGYVNAKACEHCGKFIDDWKQSGILQRGKIYPYVLKPGTWNGANVFCPKMPERYMYCTDKVVECAHKYKLTNFAFRPFEIGSGVGFRGVDYSKKNWRQKLPEQIRMFEEDFYSKVSLTSKVADSMETE